MYNLRFEDRVGISQVKEGQRKKGKYVPVIGSIKPQIYWRTIVS